MFWDNPAFVEEERLLSELHLLNVKGKGDSEEAEAIAEASEDSWNALKQIERDRINGLAAAIHMFDGTEVYDKTDLTQEQLRTAIEEAWQRRDAAQVLSLLRSGPSYLKDYQVAYMRWICYQALGHIESARLFYEHSLKVLAAAGNPLAAFESLLERVQSDFIANAPKEAKSRAMAAA